MKNLTDFRKTVETGLDPRLGLATLGESSLKKKKVSFSSITSLNGTRFSTVLHFIG